jgi:hypothetical protein
MEPHFLCSLVCASQVMQRVYISLAGKFISRHLEEEECLLAKFFFSLKERLFSLFLKNNV